MLVRPANNRGVTVITVYLDDFPNANSQKQKQIDTNRRI